MSWYTCPACGSRMENVEGDYGEEYESCPDRDCPYHVKEKN